MKIHTKSQMKNSLRRQPPWWWPRYVLVLLAATNGDAHANDGAAPGGVEQVQFNDGFLQRSSGQTIDLGIYNEGAPTIPGSYRADLYVNERWIGRSQVTLRQIGDAPSNVQICFERALLERAGVDLQKISVDATDLLGGPSGCPVLAQLVPDATAVFDQGEQRLDISIPQVSLNRAPQGYVDSRYWDDGVPAALLQYNANYYRSASQGYVFSQAYAGVSGGFNLGPWRLRHSGSLASGNGVGTNYQGTRTHLQRSLPSLRSQLLVGDAFTDGNLFDSFGFRGLLLSSDDRMLPQSQRGFAPRVTGIARSNAVIRIRQNGNIIHETNVAPGAFSIDDLYPTGYGGNLDVEVTEADGSVHVSRVPYAAAANALRPGVFRYGVAIGRFRDSQIHVEPWLMQATLQRGFTNLITGYGGIVIAEGYAAGLAGIALNTDWGAIGLDATQSYAELGRLGSRVGQSVRLSYSKLVSPTNTNITLAAYRYSSSGYLSLRDSMALRHGEEAYHSPFLRDGTPQHDILQNGFLWNGALRGRVQMAISQQLPGDAGSIHISGASQDYWNRKRRDTQFQAGYSTRFGRVSAGVSMARQYDATRGRWDNIAMLNFGIPLDIGAQRLYSSTNIQHDFNGRSSMQGTVSGSAGRDSALSFGANAMRTAGGLDGTNTSIGGNVAYASPVANLQANVSRGRGYSQVGAGLSGGIVAFDGGVAFAPSLGDTTAVIEANQASGARVTNASGLRVNRNGHALVPNLTPFASNEIELDPRGLPLSIELKTTAQHVVPTAGALVRLTFETAGGGRAMLVRATMPDGSPAPFGALALDSARQTVGIVAQFGQILVRGAEAGKQEYLLSWGEGAANQCRLPVTVAPTGKTDAGKAWTTVDAQCSPPDQQVQ
ncbi:fimbria/pilus outer membrane usher protein [Stenotrophomonas lactitubi]|uniref:fimbria/pilus outer membrane usher protein n=1 Tax=Stenotrophomonas lactitubi TaxID=2045214 RepID=UPI00320925F6